MKSPRAITPASRTALSACALLLVLLSFGVDGRPAPARAPLPDPLTLPRPGLDEPLILPLDDRLPEQKIVALMPLALRSLRDPSSVRVIVTLHEPLASGAEPRTSAERDRAQVQRLARIANVEHDFADGAARLGLRAVHGLSHFAIVIGEISPDRLGVLAALRQVEAIEPDSVLRAARAEGLALINSDDVKNDFGGDGDGAVVVVIDSGIDDTHGELAGKVAVRRTYNGTPGDGFNHGTQVAGIIAGDQGAAPQAELWDIEVLDNNGMSTLELLITALNDLVPNMDQIDILVGAFSDEMLPRFSTECDSLRPAEAEVVNLFRDAGKILIGASGNEGDGGAVGVPACLNAILATGAVYDANIGSNTYKGCTDNSTAADKIACYSNGGPLVDFYAPGHRTRAPQNGGGFDTNFGGTSAAAAYAAGAAAQLRGLLPNASGADIISALKTHGKPLTDVRSGLTRHRIDVLMALQALGGPPPPTPTRTPTATVIVTPGGPTPTRTPTRTPTLQPGQTPAAPTDLVAEALSNTAVLLEWVDHANNETGFRIESRTASLLQTGGNGTVASLARIGPTFAQVGSTGTNINYFAVEGLLKGTHYDFRVRASSGGGDSGYSNIASATTATGPSACVRDANTACLLGGQFRITGAMKNFASPPVTFETQVMNFPGGRAESDEAAFWESFEPGNFEVAVKMKNGCGFPVGHPLHHFWAFFGGLTDKETDMRIADTVTQSTVDWHNPPNHFPTTVADTMAFDCVSPGAAGNCTPNANTACLLGGRFKVTGTMKNAQNQVFVTKVIHFAQNRAETDQAVFNQSFDAGNFEVGVKMLDACSLPPTHPLRAYWIFYGGLTNAATEIRAVHTSTGNVDIWRNPAGTVPTSEGRNTASTAFPCP